MYANISIFKILGYNTSIIGGLSMSRKIPNKPFAASAEAKAPESPNKNTSPTSSTRRKAAASAPAPQAPQAASSSYRGGFQFLGILILIALAGAAGYYGVPVVRQTFDPTPENRVFFNDTILNYEVGNTGRIGVTVQGEYGRSDLRWVSSDYSVVDVDQGGNVFAKAPGIVVITAFVGNGSIQDTIVINVSEPTE